MRTLITTVDGEYKVRLAEKPKPKPGKGNCLIRLKAAALNRRDYWISKGMYPGIEEGVTLGSDGCGIVEAGPDEWAGKTVIINPNMNWGPDPEVQQDGYTILGMPTDGTLAEYVVVAIDRLIEKPAFLTDQEAAALPLAGLTAYRALFTKAGARQGKRILVTGIGGGVSQFVMSFGVAAGAEVSVTSRNEEKLQKALKCGASRGYVYKNKDWVKAALSHGKFDAVVDSAGGNNLNDYLKVIKPGGTIVVYGSTTGTPENLDIFRLFWSQAKIVGSTMGNDLEFTKMVDFVQGNKVRPIIDQVWKLDDSVEAIQSMGASGSYGKIVVDCIA